MSVPYKNKTPKARCVLKIQDWFANNLSIITQPVRDEMAELIVAEIIDDIVGGAAKDDDPNEIGPANLYEVGECAICGRTPANYTNGKDNLCSEHKRG